MKDLARLETRYKMKKQQRDVSEFDATKLANTKIKQD